MKQTNVYPGGGYSKKLNNNNLVLTIILVVVLLVFVVGVTYTIATFTSTSNANTVNTGRISMSYSEPTNALVLENSLPMSDTEGKAQSKYFEFTVTSHATTNASDSTGVTIPYEINISDITIDSGMTQLPKSKIKVNLVSVSGTTETEVLSPTLITELESSSLRDGSTKVYNTSDVHKNNSASKTTKYRLRAWIDKSYGITNADSKTYQYKFRVNVNSQVNVLGGSNGGGTTPSNPTTPQQGTLAYAIRGANDANVVTTGDGLYVSTETNDGSPTYYYHGNVENNYVNFAGKTWRVIRINEDGTIRLIYDGNFIESAFNLNYDSYEYMYYSNSNVERGIKKTLNDWYSDNLSSYDSKIATSTYCEALKVGVFNDGTDNFETYTSDFKCDEDENGYGLITDQKIGLISIDELIHAGGVLRQRTSYYLSNKVTWTMSPVGFDNNRAHAWYAGYGYINYDFVPAILGGLPVISLNADTLVTGSGASGDKWIVQ